MIKRIIFPIIIQALSIYIISLGFNGIHVGTLEGLMIVSLLLSILNITLKPILKLLAFPINILSLGLSRFVINGIVLYIALTLAPSSYVFGLGSAVMGSVLISIVNTVLDITF